MFEFAIVLPLHVALLQVATTARRYGVLPDRSSHGGALEVSWCWLDSS
jgi:hypothetical protein